MHTLAELMAARTCDADSALCDAGDDSRVQCHACAHECQIADGASGTCKVRFNRGGVLRVPWGYVAGAQCDPIEKKPFFHVEPGSLAFSFGMLGCDLKCACCQNWITSQTLRDPDAGARLTDTSPDVLVKGALRSGAHSLVSTYNEPLITSEWAVAVFKVARAAGLMTGYVSNGHATPRVLEFLAPWLDLYKVDLKGFDEAQYRHYGGRLAPVLETIRALHTMGKWVEVVTLLIPGVNDSGAEVTQMAEFLAGVSPDLPWHVTAFHPDYRMNERPGTTPAMLVRAAAVGRKCGLRYVYAGNAAGSVGDLENTNCPSCGSVLVQRRAYWIGKCRVTPDGRCPVCLTTIPGRWGARSA
jgi:pyruvate formate lyase activating enzyme